MASRDPHALLPRHATLSQAAKWHIPTMAFNARGEGGRPSMQSILQGIKSLPGHATPFVGFVEAHSLLLAGTAESLSGVFQQMARGRLPREVALVARARMADHFADVQDAVAGIAAARHDLTAAEHFVASLGQLPLGSSVEHTLVLAPRRAVEAALATGESHEHVGSSSQLAAALVRQGVFMVDATDTIDAVHWRAAGGTKAAPKAESALSLALPGPDGAQGVVVDMDRLTLATGVEEAEGGAIRVHRRPALVAPDSPEGVGAEEEVLRVHVNAHHDIDVVDGKAKVTPAPPPTPPADKVEDREQQDKVGEGEGPATAPGACSGPHSMAEVPVVGELVGKHGKCLEGETSETLLTVFTTLMMREKEDLEDEHTKQKLQIQRNVLNALASLRPRIATVVFTDNEHLAKMATGVGATVVTEGYRRVHFGIPRLLDMYRWVAEHSSAPMYGYMNGDILFGPGLLDAVELLLEAVAEGRVGHRAIIMGQRYNVRMPFPLPPDHADNVPPDMPLAELGATVDRLKQRGRLFQTDAEDYFFITRDAWNLDHIPDFVPGRRMYDNWLIDHAYRDMLVRLDITHCVWAVHLSGTDGDKAGLNAERVEPNFNGGLTAPYIGGLDKGTTTNANYRLRCGGDGLSMTHVPGNERSGERGPPWSGLRYDGHHDPLHGKTFKCKTPPAKGELVKPEHGCTYV